MELGGKIYMTSNRYQILIEAILSKTSIPKSLDEIRAFVKTQKPVTIAVKASNAEKIENQIIRWNNQLEKAAILHPKAYATPEVQKYVTSINDLTQAYDGSAASHRKVITEFSNFDVEMTRSKVAIKNVTGSIGELAKTVTLAAKKVFIWMGATTLIYGTINVFKKMVEAVKELDVSLVELQKVTDLSGASLKNFTLDAFRAGEEVGRTGKEIIDATTQFARAGYEIEQALDLAKTAAIMMNVAEGIDTAEEAASSLIATLRGYKFEAEEATRVLDLMNEVSNTSAINFDVLADGLRRTSGVLSQTGTSVEELTALLVSGFEPLRNIEKVSSGLIMISQRLRGIGEDGDAIDGLMPKLQKEFEEIAGIAIIDPETGGLRSTYDILQDMAEVFPTLTDKQRQYLSELAAGNRQVAVLNAILGNFQDTTTEYYGSATRENEKYLESIQGRMKTMQSAWQELAASTVESDFLKVLVDLGTVLLKLIDRVGVFNLAFVALGLVIGAKFLPAIPLILKGVKAVAIAFNLATTSVVTFSSALGGALLAGAIILASVAFKELTKDIRDTYETFSEATSQMKSNVDELRNLAKEYGELARKQEKSTDDLIRLIDLQTIMNGKYGAAEAGLNLYTAAYEGNTTAIQRNIAWMNKQAEIEAELYIAKQKYAYEDAVKLLEERKNYGDLLNEKWMTLQELADSIARDIEAGVGDPKFMKQRYEDIMDQIAVATKLKAEYEGQLAILNLIRKVSLGISDIEVLIETASLEELIKLANELQKSFYDVAESAKSLISAYEESGELSLKQISQLQQMFPEDYLQVLDITEGKIRLNTAALKELVVARAEDAWVATQAAASKAEDAYKEAQDAVISAQTIVNSKQKIVESMQTELEVALYVSYGMAIAFGEASQAAISAAEQLALVIDMLAVAKNTLDNALGAVDLAETFFNQFEDGSAWIDTATSAVGGFGSAVSGAYSDIIGQIVSLIRWKKQEEIKALRDELEAIKKVADAKKEELEEQLDNYKKIIEAKKDLLDQEKEAKEFSEELAEKNKDLADIENELLQLQFDNSQEGIARRLELEEEKAEKIKDINDFLYDENVENQKDALDEEYDQYEENTDNQIELIEEQFEIQKEFYEKEIDLLQDYLSKAGLIRADAMAMFKNQSAGLIQELINWNKISGTSVDEDITEPWNLAIQAKKDFYDIDGGGGGGGTGEEGGEDSSTGEGGFKKLIPFVTEHEGGVAGGVPKLKETEIFAKLLKGEVIANDSQIKNFMNNILPKIAGISEGSGANGDFNIPIVMNINGNLDKSVLPEMKEMIAETMNKALSKRGIKRNVKTYSV